MDMRSLLIKNLQQEPLFTAEQVLEEIEDMIQVYYYKFLFMLIYLQNTQKWHTKFIFNEK